MDLRSIIINALRNRVLPLFTKLRLFLSPTYLLGRVTEFVRVFLTKVLDVKPRDKDDYYPVARWLVSKRLAYAIVIVSILLCIVYIISARSALFPGKNEDAIKTYHYNSILLKFAKGKVRILGKSGYLAYEGEVSKASCNGQGTLMNPAGIVVYEGNFGTSMYEGSGKQYYEDGTMEYEGSFAQNMKDGAGKLYNNSGDVIFTGDFSRDEVLYSSLIGKDSTEMAQAYTGTRKLYVNDIERIRVCEEINAMTSEIMDENSIDDDAKIEAVYVMKNKIKIGDKTYRSFKDLESAFGKPTYTGESFATLGELLVINRLNEKSDVDVLNGPAQITETKQFTEFTTVEGYDENYVVWLHSYEKDGLVYNFVSNKDDEDFSFYYILKGDTSDEK